MKFVKNKFVQKLIIILIALMIFNLVIPKEAYAWDTTGILYKPLVSVILSVVVCVDTTIGIILNGRSIAVGAVGGVVETIVGSITGNEDEVGEGKEDLSDALNKLFVGPDTIFSGNVLILDANIFKTINITEYEGWGQTFSSVSSAFDTAEDVTSPGYHMIFSIREAIASIYKILRDICAYVMLAGLIYTGIQVLITSNNPQKQAHWRALIFDWFVGMVLLIFSHVLMVGIFYISDLLVDALGSTLNGFGGMNYNLVVQCFLSFDSAEQIICIIMLIYLIYLTIMFTIAYFKRFMWITVLIVIAPIVSIMYSFGNRTKQIYSKWLEEYIITVFIQPFHIVIYYILVSIPLNITNSTGEYSFNLNNSTLLEVVYALVALGFIRPAEKYVRNLFGMGRGIAGLASYDSARQTVQEVKAFIQKEKEKVAKVGKTATTVAGTAIGAYFGGPEGAKIGKQIGQAVGEAGEQQVKSEGEGLGLGGMGQGDDDYLGALIEEEEDKFGTSEYDPTEKEALEREAWANKEGPTDEEVLEGTKNTREEFFDLALQAENEGDTATADQYLEMAAELDENASNLENKIKEKETEETEEKEEAEEKEEKTDSTEKARENSKGQGEQKETSDSNEKNITAAVVNVDAGNANINTDSENEEKDSEDTEIKKADKETADSKETEDVEDFKLKDNDEFSWEKMMRTARDTGLVDDAIDLGNETYKGLNSIFDTFMPEEARSTQDWKASAGLIDEMLKASGERRKERVERMQTQFVNNEGNKQFMIDNMRIGGKSLTDYYNDKYSGKANKDILVKEAVDKKAEEGLEKMKGYAVYGMTAEQAYPLYQDQKEFGFTPEEAIRNRAGFERFDTNIENVNFTNDKYQSAGIHVEERISEIVPDAKAYYANGHRDIKDMLDLNFIQQKLNVTCERAMQIDSVLRKQGKIECGPKKSSETDKEYRARQEMYSKINDMYKSKNK